MWNVKMIDKICKKNDILLAFDEMQAGFGRTGKNFGYEHYDVKPDLLACGKGMGGGVPLSGVIGKAEIMDLPDIGNMSSTHSGNPLVCLAGIAVLNELNSKNLVKKAKVNGDFFYKHLCGLKKSFPHHISWILGKGMIYSIIFSKKSSNIVFVSMIAERCMEKGLLVVHTGRESIKLGPPLTITKESFPRVLNLKKKDYLQIIYNEKDKPFTSYPNKLAKYIWEKYQFKHNCKMLDIGCGRGEFLKAFTDCGARGYGVDLSDHSKNFYNNLNLKIADIQNEGIPYPDDYFDITFSKSVIEHFYYPEKIIKETYRILKPGGISIILCPSWEYNYKIYFEDYTHRTPFMRESLRDMQLIHGFEEVSVKFFRQLPSTWYNSKLFFFLSELTRLFIPEILKKYFKWVKFSKEVMLLSYSKKPIYSEEVL